MQNTFAGAKDGGVSLPLDPKREAESGADHAPTGIVGRQDGSLPPDLQAVVDAWGDLPGAVKVGIVAMVKAAKG